MASILRRFRVIFMTLCVAFSLLLVFNVVPMNKDKGVAAGNGLDYGLDFAGGFQMHLRLERPATTEEMDKEKTILERRVNAMGLKNILVRPYRDQYILIEVANSSEEEKENVKNIIKQQARFEQLIDGDLATKGDEITLDTGTAGSGIQRVTNGYNWFVGIEYNTEGAHRIGNVATGKEGRPIDMFIDRPVNSTILMSQDDYNTMLEATVDYSFGDTTVDIIEKRARIPITVLKNETDLSAELKAMQDEGYLKIIIAGSDEKIPEDIRGMLEAKGFETKRVECPQVNDACHIGQWVKDLTGLESSPALRFDPKGKPWYNAQISGTSPTQEGAKDEVTTTLVLLSSGNLPIPVTIGSETNIPPTLGMRFLNQGLIAGFLAIICVSLMMFARYRHGFIVIPIIITSLSEIIMILGIAAAIDWSIDLAAIAGLIAAVGTGVDDQIVITDETLQQGRKKEKVVSIAERIKRSFFIIFTAAAATIAAMLPLLGIYSLKGFAFTTIIGVLVGVLITRPAYATAIEELLKRREA